MCANLQDFPYAQLPGLHGTFRPHNRSAAFGLRPSIQAGEVGWFEERPDSPMREQPERWMQLCAQAATEEDPTRLMALVDEINDLLEQKERHLAILLARSRECEKPQA